MPKIVTIGQQHARAKLDAVSLEVTRNRLQSLAEEIGMALIRTAYSPNIKDRRDCSAGLYSEAGELIAQAEHIPLHLGLMPTLVKNVLDEVNKDALEPGDTLIVNDTYRGGSHLADICLISPVFNKQQLIGFVANMAHHVDIGGIAPGSMSVEATEIFHEGVRIPPIHLVRHGELVEDLVNLLLSNMRVAQSTKGDIFAQIAANRLGVARLLQISKEWGVESLLERQTQLLEYSEQRTRRAIAELPNGVTEFVDFLEYDGWSWKDIPISVRIEKLDDRICFDLTGSADQVPASINCSYAVTRACAAYVLKTITDPSLPSNAGLVRAMEVQTKPGSIVDASFPAPVANGNINTSTRIVDAMLGAVGLLVPGKASGASCGSQNVMTLGGVDPLTGKYFSYVETYAGGQGAREGADGADGVHTHMTNTRNTPCEVIESEYPLRVVRYELAEDTGGAGQWRGGTGLRRELELTRGSAFLTICTERMHRKPWGLRGGGEGANSAVEFRSQGSVQELPPLASRQMRAGDRISIQTAGGGGFGERSKRSVELLRRDTDSGLANNSRSFSNGGK